MALVVDASVVVRMLVRTGPDAAPARAAVAGHDLNAPHLLDVEVAAALRSLAAAGALTAARAAQALEDHVALGVDRYPHELLLPRVWQLRQNLSAYGATYAALAETLDCPLLTSDRGLATAPGPLCERRHLP